MPDTREVMMLTCQATEMGTRAALDAARQALAAYLSADVAGSVEIVLAEILNNVVEHAYAGRPAGDIHISGLVGPGGLTLTIEDRGAALPGEALPEGAPASLDVADCDLPEGGFGWFLIRTLTSDLHYVRDGGTNRLTIRFDSLS